MPRPLQSARNSSSSARTVSAAISSSKSLLMSDIDSGCSAVSSAVSSTILASCVFIISRSEKSGGDAAERLHGCHEPKGTSVRRDHWPGKLGGGSRGPRRAAGVCFMEPAERGIGRSGNSVGAGGANSLQYPTYRLKSDLEFSLSQQLRRPPAAGTPLIQSAESPSAVPASSP